MASLKLKPTDQDLVQAKLADGHYDRLLEEFREKLDAATVALRRCHEAMRAANTFRS